ncbi:MAG: hypothetical protein MK085_07745, partial [Phycisphaerales bacterium]|nr:hypothetical protein [Phycisphaerales bacterium]
MNPGQVEHTMAYDKDVERLLEILLSGDRAAARVFVEELLERGIQESRLVHKVVAEVIQIIGRLEREDRLSNIAVNTAVRLLRLVATRIAEHASFSGGSGRRISIYCGPSNTEELSAEVMSWLLEFDGHDVRLGGGGVPADEIQAEVESRTPDVLLLYASSPSDAPGIRLLIDSIREQDACPEMQIAVGGGVFDRAPGLAEEIGADLWALDDDGLRAGLIEEPEQRAFPEQRTV